MRVCVGAGCRVLSVSEWGQVVFVDSSFCGGDETRVLQAAASDTLSPEYRLSGRY